MDRRQFLTGIAAISLVPTVAVASVSEKAISKDVSLEHQIRRHMYKLYREFALFELNDDLTRHTYSYMLSAKIDNLVANRKIYSYHIVCNEECNPPELIDRNGFEAIIYYKKTLSPDINFIRLSDISSMEFTEY